MRRALLSLLILAGCQFQLPAPTDTFLCPSSGGTNCNSDGQPFGTSSGGTGRTTSSRSSSSGSASSSSSGSSSSSSSGSKSASSSGSTSSGSSSSSGGCPFNDGGTVYVSALGSDHAGTGVESPASCAFRSLTTALAKAGSAGIPKVLALGADPGNAAIFDSPNGETFPLQIPTGVTLSTDIEASGGSTSSEAYEIEFDSPSAASAVVLSTGSSIVGFTVQTLPIGNAAAVAVSCGTPGSSSVADSLLQGPENGSNQSLVLSNPGVEVTGQCSLSLSNVTVQDYGGAGVSLANAASAAIDGGSILNNGWGETDGGCTGDGIHMESTGALSIDNTTIAGSYWYGLHAQSGTVTGTNVSILGIPATGANFGYAFGGLGLGDFYFCSTNSSARVTLTNVEINGLGSDDYDGVDLVGGTLALLGDVSITRHGYFGVDVFSGTAYLENPTIKSNWGSGVRNDSLGVTAPTLTLDGGTIGPDDVSATGFSELVFSNTGAGNLALIGTTVQDNPHLTKGDAWGVDLGGPGAYSLTNCDIVGNGGTGLHLNGTSNDLKVFSGNRIHDNGGDQILVSGGSWNLSAPAGCDGGQNAIYGYQTGYVGLAVDAGKATANDDSWQNPTPVAGVDYYGSLTTPAASCGDAG